MEKKQGITLNDILIILDIINVASSRNAFRIEEYSAVGEIHQKLTSIVQTSNTAQQAETDTQPSNEEPKND